MDEKQENIEKAIYAIIAMSKNDIHSLENNLEFKGVLHGINGTCFFISSNTFITAHHCLNKTYTKDQIYFLINKNGHIINGVKIDFEDSDSDMCVGKIDISIDTYCKLSTETLIVGGQKFTAYGFSAKDTQNFEIKIIKENDKIKIIKHDSLILKKVEYNYFHHFLLKNHLSSDLAPIHLINCNVVIFDKSLELGFSGGPTFNNVTNELVGFTSQDIFYKNSENPVTIVIPVINNNEKI